MAKAIATMARMWSGAPENQFHALLRWVFTDKAEFIGKTLQKIHQK
jgi:hypothetical protein